MAYLYLTEQIGIAAAFGVWAYVVGKGLFAGSSLRLSPVEEVALLVPAGLAVAIGLLFGLGIVGVLTGPWILASAGLLLAFACWRLRDHIVAGLSGTVRAIARREILVRLLMIAIVQAPFSSPSRSEASPRPTYPTRFATTCRTR